MFYAYVRQSFTRPVQLYRGHTSNLTQRLAEQDSGKCPHTSKYATRKVLK
jgi:hypothetical protein